MEKLILFGAGEIGLKWINKLGEENIYAFIDSDSEKIGKRICGKKVLSIDDVCKLSFDKKIFISTSIEKKKEIVNLLIERGLKNDIVDTPYWESGNYIELNAYVDNESVLEGKNAIWSNTYVKESFIGYGTYIGSNSMILNAKIGKYSAIGPSVKIIRGQHPTKKFVSIYPGFYSAENSAVRISFTSEDLFEEYKFSEYPYAVTIGNDVWIGAGASLMEGVKIADGTIVAAGAMVVKNTEPYTIVGGIPAKVISNRFSKEDKEFLLKLEWWNKPEEWIKTYSRYFNDVRKLKIVIESKN